MPPTPQRQTMRPQTRPSANGKADSVLAEAVPIESIRDDAIHMLLYGRNRIGKTTLACQFPKPLLLVSLEPTKTGGARSVRKVPGVNYLRITDSYRFERLGHELRDSDQAGRLQFKTIVVDSGSSLDEITLAEICGWTETAVMIAVGHTRPGAKVSTDQYTERSERMRKILRPYLDLSCDLVIVCNEKDHNPPEGMKNAFARGMQAESFFGAAMGAGTTRWVQDCCDYVCQLYMEKETVVRKSFIGKPGTANYKETEIEEETGRLIRRLRTTYHPNFAAGFRSCDPAAVPEWIDEPTYEKIRAVADGKKLTK